MQRVVVDARVPNSLHMRPPHSRLGTPAVVADVSASSAAFHRGKACEGEVDVHAASLDLQNCF